MPNIELVRGNIHNIKYLETINNSVFSIKYSKKWYAEIAHDEETTVVAFYKEIPVGGIVLSYERQHELYVKTLAVLPRYQRKGVGKALLEYGTDLANQKGLQVVSAHMWENNPVGLEFYLSRGFEKKAFSKNYYGALNPPGAWLMSLTIA